MFSPCSAKRRASDKDLPVQYLYLMLEQTTRQILNTDFVEEFLQPMKTRMLVMFMMMQYQYAVSSFDKVQKILKVRAALIL